MAAMIRNRKFVRTALAATFGVVMVVASGAAVLAADDQDENLLPDVKFFRNVMRAIGLRNGQEAGVDAHERAPLVLPPTRDLPPPAAPGSLTENNPAWPSDPDVKRRKAEQKMQAEAKPYDYLASGNPLTPTELAAGKTDKPSVKSGDGPDHSPELNSEPTRICRRAVQEPNEHRQSIFRREKDRNRDIQARAGAGVPDRSAGRLSLAVADPALRR